ncbi:MAG: c-type cytochrome [Myxococcales bacterium]|nr:c-type cytochrome [Myxococcales bacterium]
MKIVKRVLLALAALVVLGVSALLVRFYGMLPKARAAENLTAPNTPEAIERGRYLVHHVTGCVGCHSKVDETRPGEPLVEGHAGEGRDFGDVPGFPGHIRAGNLTPDKATGIGGWTDGEIARAMREGIAKDGRALFPMMPYQSFAKTLSDADTLAIIAYLRTLPVIKNDPGRMEVNFPVSMFIRAAPAPLSQPSAGAPPDGVDRGNWLLTAASCHDCHDSVNQRREPLPGMSLAGGTPFNVPGKGQVLSANITSDPATGIGSYTDDDLMRVFNEGVGKDGRALYGMPWPYYKGMTDGDKRALIAALRTVKAVTHAVAPPPFK